MADIVAVIWLRHKVGCACIVKALVWCGIWRCHRAVVDYCLLDFVWISAVKITQFCCAVFSLVGCHIIAVNIFWKINLTDIGNLCTALPWGEIAGINICKSAVTVFSLPALAVCLCCGTCVCVVMWHLGNGIAKLQKLCFKAFCACNRPTIVILLSLDRCYKAEIFWAEITRKSVFVNKRIADCGICRRKRRIRRLCILCDRLKSVINFSRIYACNADRNTHRRNHCGKFFSKFFVHKITCI